MINPSPRPSYFTCTLSEALEYNQAHHSVRVNSSAQGRVVEHQDFSSITSFVDFLAEKYGDHLAAGCVVPRKDGGAAIEQLNFKEVKEHSCRVAQYFSSIINSTMRLERESQCVALLSSSSIVFMLTWLGLMRAGYEVVLIAPQSSPSSIKHLLKESAAFAVIYDFEHEATISEGVNEFRDFGRLKIPWFSLFDLQHWDIPSAYSSSTFAHSAPTSISSTAFNFHSSGTTGLPKLIPQTHNGAVGILPHLQYAPSSQRHDDFPFTRSRIASFTTTPLYSGGIADLFRVWSAAAPLWIFAEGRAPTIGSSVLDCLKMIDEVSGTHQGTRKWKLGYLSCVPFVLENLVQTPQLKKRLRQMDAVGVGGAAMSKALGDKLIGEGIRLVSRFGSSECGFLLSSHREYDNDLSWDVLRTNNTNSKGLEFKPMDNSGRNYELIVTEDWPLVSTAKHAQRPFNTHDVFVKHASIEGGWTYIGRSDSQITLSTGKKFDPTTIDDALRASDLVEEAIVVGDDRPFPAVIVIPSKTFDNLSTEEQEKELRILLERVNRESVKHAIIVQGCLVALDQEQRKKVRRNNKGGVVRSAILADFEEELSRLYSTSEGEKNGTLQRILPQNAASIITAIVQDALGSQCDVKSDTVFFEAGVDSTLSIRIRKKICDSIPSKVRSRVPVNVVYECGTVETLVKFITEQLNDENAGAQTASMEDERRAKHQEMLDFVNKYVDLQPRLLTCAVEATCWDPKPRVRLGASVVLTGATGFLGVHVLNRLLVDPTIFKIYVCVRGSRLVTYKEQAGRAKARVDSAIEFHKFDASNSKAAMNKVEYVPFVLNEPCLGVPPELYRRLIDETTHVVHAAWDVNFNLPLKTFAAQIEGTVNLFNLLVLASRRSDDPRTHPAPSLRFCSSVASVANEPRTSECAKGVSDNPAHAAELGYGQSKWVAERVLHQLAKRNPSVSVSILRVGQLSGDTVNGIWNRREAWPLMIDASLNALATDGRIVLPDLGSAPLPPLDWLPVNEAAGQLCRQLHIISEVGEPRVVSISNNSHETSWSEAQDWIGEWAESRRMQCTIIPADEWLDQLEALAADHQAKALISLWRKNWLVQDSPSKVVDDEDESRKTITEGSSMEMRSRQTDAPSQNFELDKPYVWRVLDWISRDD